jgi:hypothetical protein
MMEGRKILHEFSRRWKRRFRKEEKRLKSEGFTKKRARAEAELGPLWHEVSRLVTQIELGYPPDWKKLTSLRAKIARRLSWLMNGR